MDDGVFFWLVAGALTFCVAALLGLAMLRGGRTGTGPTSDVEVYKSQLKEIDRDVERGVISAEEAERVRLEVSRRLLAADAAAGGATTSDAPPALTMILAFALVGATILCAGALYAVIGSPGAVDQPLTARLSALDAQKSARPSQQEMEARLDADFTPPTEAGAEYLALMAQLRAAVAERPDDLEGHILLARSEARLGNFLGAHPVQARIIALKAADATIEDYTTWADYMVIAAQGYVSPEAEAAVDWVLGRDPQNGPARYYKGLAHAQSGRHDLAYPLWNDLLGDSRANDPWVPLVMGQIESVARAAGARFRPPQLEASPIEQLSEDDIHAASQMSAEDRALMIRGMVDSLGARLAREGGPPEDWARLIRSLGVLGEVDRAAEIWAEAQIAFDGFPDAIDTIRIAAESVGAAQIGE